MTGQKKVEREGAGTAETSHIAADPAPARRRRLTAARKQEAVLRVLPGETVQPVARNIDATAADVSGWRDAFPEGGVSNLKYPQENRLKQISGEEDPCNDANPDTPINLAIHPLVADFNAMKVQIDV